MAKGKKHNRSRHKSYTGMRTRQQQIDAQQQRELQDARKQVDFSSDVPTEDELFVETNSESLLPPEEPPQKWYVVDTNLILSCVDIIYDADDEDWRKPIGFKPNLDNAHIIIPYVVFEELNHIKEERSLRGMIARIAFDRLKKFFPNSERMIGEILNLESPIPTGLGKQTISILPLHRNFSKILPYVPGRDDNDGWIAVTALAATMISYGMPVDGTFEIGDTKEKVDVLALSNSGRYVTLLTNDNSLLSKADLFGVRVKSYSFKKRPPFTGCRELTVPAEMFEHFYHEEHLSREEFEEYMPDELPLVANEYLIMTPEDDRYPRGYFTVRDDYVNVARYHKENDMIYPLRFAKREGPTPANAGIATYYDALNDDKIQIVNVTGSAGTGKTYQAVVHAIKEIKAGKYSQAILIPSRGAKNPLGALPGNQNQKMEPLIAAAKDAIRSYLAKTPEFLKKREELRHFGDNDTGEEEERNDAKTSNKKSKGNRNNRNPRDTRRTRGNFTGSFDDIDGIDYHSYDYAAKDFPEPHSRKKEKAFYPGKTEKTKGDGSEGKMTYREMLNKQVDYIYNRYFTSMPYEDAQGHSFEDSIIILDEFQRVMIDDADTLITRPGKGAKLIICGDIDQIHDSSPEKQFKNGLNYSRMLFFDEPICANVQLTKNMRGDIARVMTENRRKVRRRMGQI